MIGTGGGALDLGEGLDHPGEVLQLHARDVEVLLRAQGLDAVVGIGWDVAVSEQVVLAAGADRRRTGAGHRGILRMSLWPTALPAPDSVTAHGSYPPYHGRVPAPRSPHTLRAAFRRQAVLTLALVALALIVVLGATVSASLAGILLSALLLALALLRALLPVRAVGALAVRSRGLDTAVLVVLALGIAALATSPNL